MNDARLEAFMTAVLEDIAERRSAEERAAFATRLADIASYMESAAPSDRAEVGVPSVADELRAIERFISRHPRLEP